MHPTLSSVVFFQTSIFLFSSLILFLGVIYLFIYLFICLPMCLCIKESPIMPYDLNIKNHGIGKLKTIKERNHVFNVAIDNLHLWFKIKFLFKL